MTTSMENDREPAEVLTTARMRLVPSTVELVRAEIGDRVEFARLLEARVPSDWPPDEAADALPWFLDRLGRGGPGAVGWYGFYGIARTGVDEPPVLIGGGGCLGPPVDGIVEIGYSVLPAYQRMGYATEMMAAIVAWVNHDPRVRQIKAETDVGNVASRRLLLGLGFQETGRVGDSDRLDYVRDRPDDRDR